MAGGSARALARPLLNETGVPVLSNRNFHQAIRTDTHKCVEHANGERELYDLRSDPDELVNVAGDPAQAGTLAQLDAGSGAQDLRRRVVRRPAAARGTRAVASAGRPSRTR